MSRLQTTKVKTDRVKTDRVKADQVRAERTTDRLSIEELVALFRQTVADIAAGRSKLYRSEEEFLASLGLAGAAR